jgi:hypothetical protein
VTQSKTSSRPASPAVAAWTTLGLWIGLTAAVGAAAQAGAWLIGVDFEVLGSGAGSSLLIVTAVVTLIGLMASDDRPLTEFGIHVGPDWSAQLGRAMLIGGGAFAAYHLVGLACGAFAWQSSAIGWKLLKGTLEVGLTAIPIAAAQQVIFSGYLLRLLRSAVGRTVALALCGGLFALSAIAGKSGVELAAPETQWLAINFGLLAVLLAVVRLKTGSVLMSTGILAGALVVRRIVWKSRLLALQPDHPLADWFALGNDSRQGPLLALLVGMAAVAVALRMWRTGEAQPATSGPALSAEFKRFFPFSCILALAPLDLWWGRLVEAKFRIDPIYLPRLAWVLCASAVNTLITWPERLLAPRLLKHTVPDPVLIVGVHRSGTTHLHNLLALDPQFSVPRNINVLNAAGALVMGWFITPLLGLFMNMRRPMDAMRVSLFSSQEEEFAIAGLSRLSAYWGFMFPRETARHDRCIYPEDMTDAERAEWRGAMLLFLRKLTFWRRRPPLLKSPYNTARVDEFRGMFPGVKAIHICRHPYQTYLSNMHLAEHGLSAFQVQDPASDDNYRTRFLDQYRRMEDSFYRDARRLNHGQVAEVRYEDLSANPVEEIRRLYAELGLPYTLAYDLRLRKYLAGLAGYTKNKHPRLEPAVQAKIDSRMGFYLDRWGYREEAAAPAAKAA